MIFNVTNAAGAISGMPMVRVYDSTGKLKGFGGTGGGTVTSVGLSMPSGFTVASSPVTGAGVLTVTANGTALDYIDGTGAIQTFPTVGSGTVTSVQLTAGTGISLSGTNPITTSGNITVTNSAPDQTVSLSTTGTGLAVTGTYPNFTLQNTLPDQTVVLSGGTGISVSGTYPSFTIDNTAPGTTYTVNNGLTANFPTNFQLGGLLVADTTIDGNGNNLQFHLTNLFSSVNTAKYVFSFATNDVGNNTLLSLDSGNNISRFSHEDAVSGDISAIELIGTELRVQTPAYATATNGDVLTLLDNTTGEAEWQTIPGTALGFQDVLINNSTLTQNNTVLGANFNFTWSGFNRFTIETDQFTSINSTSGSNTAAISANSLGVAPYVDLNVKNGTDIVGIYLDTNEIDLYTPAIDNSTATAGDVFTLVNATTGEGEWQTPADGGLPYGVASGTNNYTVTISGVTSYTAGDAYIISFTNGNDDDSDININGLGVKTLVKEFDVQLTGGDIVSGQELIIMYDGTNFQTLGVAPNQLFAYVTNDDSVTITKGQPVYAFGAAGNRMSVKLAYNTSDATSAQTVGVVFSTSIAAGQKGFIITQGAISGLNTSAFAAGAQLYLGATAGSVTDIKPFAPNHLVYIGIVERSNAGNGQIYVKPQNGFELEELHDVDLITTPPTNNDVLVFDTSTTPDLWKAKSIPTILGYTPEPSIQKLVLSGGDVTTTSNLASNITGLVTSTLAANSTYYFSGRFRIGCNNTGGIKFAVTVPTGATPHIAFLSPSNTGGTAFSVTTILAASTLSTVNVNPFNGTGTCIVHGVVVTSATAGTAQLQFASGTSGQTSTIYGSGLSLITVMKVA